MTPIQRRYGGAATNAPVQRKAASDTLESGVLGPQDELESGVLGPQDELEPGVLGAEQSSGPGAAKPGGGGNKLESGLIGMDDPMFGGGGGGGDKLESGLIGMDDPMFKGGGGGDKLESGLIGMDDPMFNGDANKPGGPKKAKGADKTDWAELIADGEAAEKKRLPPKKLAYACKRNPYWLNKFGLTPNDFGYGGGAADPNFAYHIAASQEERGLVVDGIAGPKTTRRFGLSGKNQRKA